MWRWSLDADAIAVSGVREARAAGHLGGRVEDLQRIKDTTTGSRPRRLRCSPTSSRSGRSAASRPRCRATSPTPESSSSAARRASAPSPCSASSPTTSSSTSPVTTSCCPARSRPIRSRRPRRDRRVRLAARPRLHQGSGRRPGRLRQRQGRPLRRRGRRRHHRLVLRADALRPARPRGQGGDHQHGLRGPARPRSAISAPTSSSTSPRSPSTSSSSLRCTRRWSPRPCPPARAHDRRPRPVHPGRRARTAAAVAPRPPPQEPLLVRHPPAVDRVLQERRAARAITNIPGMSQVVEKPSPTSRPSSTATSPASSPTPATRPRVG